MVPNLYSDIIIKLIVKEEKKFFPKIQFDFSITGEHEPNDDECQWPSDDEGKYIFYLLQAARD